MEARARSALAKRMLRARLVDGGHGRMEARLEEARMERKKALALGRRRGPRVMRRDLILEELA